MHPRLSRHSFIMLKVPCHRHRTITVWEANGMRSLFSFDRVTGGFTGAVWLTCTGAGRPAQPAPDESA